MSNGQLHDDKLFQGLHDRLSDYEAPYDGADWDAMNRSLDKLPKTNQFRWKFSLNTIGIVLGIVGLTVLGVVIANGNGKSGNPAGDKNVTVNQTTTPVVNTQQQQTVTQPIVSAPAITDNHVTVAVPEMNTVQDLNKRKPKPETNTGPFLFGDQIDPTKGFVYNTEEDPALIKDHSDLKKPEVYYDNENGEIRKIIIPNDSAEHIKEIKTDSASAPVIEPEPAVPTEGQRIGFDQNP